MRNVNENEWFTTVNLYKLRFYARKDFVKQFTSSNIH